MQDLFIELFPIIHSDLPDLVAYLVEFEGEPVGTRVGKIAYRLNRTFPGIWVGSDNIVITDAPVASIQIEIAIEHWKNELPDLYGNLAVIDEIMLWQPSPQNIADFVFWSRIIPIEDELRLALDKMSIAVEHGRIEREYKLLRWVVDNEPALSVTIDSQMLYDRNLSQYTEEIDNRNKVVGLPVTDRTSTMTGIVKSITGTIFDKREHLMALTRREVMQTILQYAPDEELVVEVESGNRQYEYPASALHILIDPTNHDELQQFNISPQYAERALNLRPDARSQLVKILSDKLKDQKIIGNAYNSRTNPNQFLEASFEYSVEFGKNRTRDFSFESLAYDFQQSGLYDRNSRFDDAPITIAIINTLDEPIDDFVEALRRDLERNYKFKIDMLRERKVRVISNKNLESAVRVVEKENPHIVLAFLPNTSSDNHDTLDPNFQQIKSLALGKGIASHAIYQKTVHDPDSMPRVVMGILGKTGNTPYVLAEPLDYADMVVGMDMVRQELTQFDRVTAIARIYDNLGKGYGYIMETVELEKGDPVPYIVMQTLFPEERFSGKRVLVHRSGQFTIEELKMLARWEKVINTTFFPISIDTDIVPHLYSLDKRTIKEPDWGAIFLLDDLQAMMVTSMNNGDNMAMPLHVTAPSDLGIHLALHSVLMWTLLHYGTTRPVRLPVTIQYAHEMQQWMSRGQLPSVKASDVPFWL